MRIDDIVEISRRELKKCWYKHLYGSKLQMLGKVRFRRGLIIKMEKNAQIIIGDGCFFNNYCSINSHEKVEIGSDCIFGENVKIYDHNHIYESRKIPISQQGFKSKEIKIGTNCWIGSNCVILAGVTIGDNCVIGASNVIYKDIPSDSVVIANNQMNIRARKYSDE